MVGETEHRRWSYVKLTRVTVGGERETGDKRDSSTWGRFLSTLAFPRSVGFLRRKQNQTRAIINATVAAPPTAPVKEMEDVRLCDDSPKSLLTTDDCTCLARG